MIGWLKKIDHQLFFPFQGDTASAPDYRFRNEHRYPYGPVTGFDVWIDPVVKAYFDRSAADWRLLEYHYCHKEGCLIEPRHHWAITRKQEILKASAWIYYENGVPKPYYLEYRLRPKAVRKQEALVSVHTAWNNYWHFYNDIIGQLAMAEACAETRDLPVLIPQGLWERSYFHELLALSPRLQQKQWIVQQPGTYIDAGEAHFFCAPFAHRRNYDAALDYLAYEQRSDVHPGGHKIFLTRSTKRGRTLQNEAEVLALVTAAGFEVVDCDGLSLTEQIKLFGNAAVVMGIHGAAFTNIIYRRGLPLHVVELFPAGFLNPCYYWMSQQYGFQYSALRGAGGLSAHSRSEAFVINTQQLEHLLNTYLSK